jgi:hypothetical protein
VLSLVKLAKAVWTWDCKDLNYIGVFMSFSDEQIVLSSSFLICLASKLVNTFALRLNKSAGTWIEPSSSEDCDSEDPTWKTSLVIQEGKSAVCYLNHCVSF